MSYFPRKLGWVTFAVLNLWALSLAHCWTVLYPKMYSQTYAFGDSLTDSGNAPALLAAPVPVTDEFTWAQYFSQSLGTQNTSRGDLVVQWVAAGGPPLVELGRAPQTTNYAYAGFATAPTKLAILNMLYDQSILPSSDLLIQALGGLTPALENQIKQTILNSPRKLDPKALYTVWAGANDILNPGAAAGVHAVAVDNVIQSIQLLQLAGAKNPVVFNLPKLSSTPRHNNAGGIVLANESVLFNQRLYQQLPSLKTPVLIVDIETLLDEVIARPQLYGFINVTHACNAGMGAAGALAGNCETNLFWDGIHPTSRAHRIMADLLKSMVTSPVFAAHLSSNLESILQMTREPNFAWHRFNNKSWQAGFSALYSRNNISHASKGHASPAVASFALAHHSTQTHTRLTASLVNNHHRIDDLGQFSATGLVAGLNSRYHLPNYFIQGGLQWGMINFNDMRRTFQLGDRSVVARGNTQGFFTDFHIRSGFHFIADKSLQTGPFAELDYQMLKVNGFKESGGFPANMVYQDQNKSSSQIGFGWQINWKTSINQQPIALNLALSGHRQWLGQAQQIRYKADTVPDTFAQWVAPKGRATQMKLHSSIQWQFAPDWQSELSAQWNNAPAANRQYAAQIQIKRSF